MQGFTNDGGLRPLPPPDESIIDRGVAALRASTPTRRAPARRSIREAGTLLDGVGGLGWSVAGFVGGAVFWHFVGFWGFVSDVVLAEASSPPAAKPGVVDVALPPKRAEWLQIADASLPACTLLSLDRRTGATSARPCDADHAPLTTDSFQGREDRVMIPEASDPRPDASGN